MANALGIDLDKEENAFPNSLKKEYDIISRTTRENRFSEKQRSEYELTAKNVHIDENDGVYHVRPVANISEYNKFKASLMNNQQLHNRTSPTLFTLVVFDLVKNRTKFLIEIEGHFENGVYKRGTLITVLGFGNSNEFVGYRYKKLLAYDKRLADIFQKYNIS
jgi:hypothetical protein